MLFALIKEHAFSMTAKVRCVCVAFFFVYAIAAAQEPPIMKAVRAKYNEKTSLETRFDLHIFWKVREREETKSGKIYCAPGDKFRVELGPTIWVSNGENYWQCDQDEKGTQVVIKRLSDVSVAMLPSHILNTYVAEHGYRLAQETPTAAVVEWKSDSLGAETEARVIRISIEKKNAAISSLFITDNSGNESTYSFKKTKFPAKLPESLFEYTPPKGVSILDMRN